MKSTAKSNLLKIFLLVLGACHSSGDEEIYSPEPQIEFVNIQFEETADVTTVDTLKLTFSITDGDKDFGLDYANIEHQEFPYQRYFYYLKSNGTKVPSDKLDRGEIDVEDLISYEDRANPPYDTLPPLDEWCYDYYTISESEYAVLYADVNEHSPNLFVDFMYENTDGSFTKFSDKRSCGFFNARIPSISSLPANESVQQGPFTIKMTSAKRGQITYSMASNGFMLLFGKKTMKLRVYVKDRALHVSNVLETPTFVLEDL